MPNARDSSVFRPDNAPPRTIMNLNLDGLDPAMPLVHESPSPSDDALMILLPLLIVFSTLLFFLLIFLVCMLLLRRRRGILLRDNDGPIDLSREDLIEGEGGFEGVESRWLENASEEDSYSYRRAKGTQICSLSTVCRQKIDRRLFPHLEYQQQYPPNSTPTDITLSQFLSIQEKGVSAWSFEPEYESLPSTIVQSRTELTFLPDPSSASSVQSNLPLPQIE